MAARKSLSHVDNAEVRERLRAIIAREFGGNQTRAAKAFGLSQSYLSTFLSQGRGGGPTIMRVLAAWDPDAAMSLLRLEGERMSSPDEGAAWDAFARRYPNGAKVFAALRELGEVPEGFRGDVALHFPGDPTIAQWKDIYRVLFDAARAMTPNAGVEDEAAALERVHEREQAAARKRKAGVGRRSK